VINKQTIDVSFNISVNQVNILTTIGIINYLAFWYIHTSQKLYIFWKQ